MLYNHPFQKHARLGGDTALLPGFRIINPPPNYQMKEEDQALDGSSSLEMLLRINCPGGAETVNFAQLLEYPHAAEKYVTEPLVPHKS